MNRRLKNEEKAVIVLIIGLIVSIGLEIPKTSAETPGLKLTTPFPHVVIGSGDTVDRNITIENPTNSDKLVNLRVTTVNEKWTASLKEAGVEVRSAYLSEGEKSILILSISPPLDIKPGTYPVKLQALDQNGNVLDTLELLVEVKPSAEAGIEVTTQYPNMEGPPGKEMKFSVKVVNNGSRKTINYKVNIEGQEGWKTNITPQFESKTIKSQAFEAGEEKTINLTVTPPDTAKAGEYTVDFLAFSEGSSDNLTLNISIPGTYKLNLTTKSGRLNTEVTKGKKASIQLLVKNTGTAPLGAISLESGLNLPSGWNTTFNPDEISLIAPNDQKLVQLTLETAQDTVPGDYSFKINANAKEPYDRSASFDLRVTVSPGTSWGFIGIGIIVIILAGLFLMFWRLGRR